MASYKLLFQQSVAKDLRALPKAYVARILKRIEALADNPGPPGCEKRGMRQPSRPVRREPPDGIPHLLVSLVR